MHTEHGFQPNCSEVVFNLRDMTKEEVLAILRKHGIEEMSVKSSDLYAWNSGDDEECTMLSDSDNSNIPDMQHHASLAVHDDYAGCVNYDGASIVGGQHCQSQMYPTMKKISDIFDEEGYHAEWTPDDGGSVTAYEDWVDKGCKPEDGFQLGLKFSVCRLTALQIEEVKEFVCEEFGLDGHEVDAEVDDDCFGSQKVLDFGNIPFRLVGILPQDVGSKKEVIVASYVRMQIDGKIDEILKRDKED